VIVRVPFAPGWFARALPVAFPCPSYFSCPKPGGDVGPVGHYRSVVSA
jgi:hypothetical protein